MNTLKTAAAAVTGARHLRMARNGQDAVATWQHGDVAVVAVADGCGSGASSEVGARLGVELFVRGLAARITEREPWDAARAEVRDAIARLCGDDERLLREAFMFTLVAAVVTPEATTVWALGDGAYSFGDYTRALGPFADNQPPYLAYDVVGEPREAVIERVCACDAVIIATDGADDLQAGIERFAAPRFVEHPDVLRRELALLARANERIDWTAGRVVRTAAVLQDDCAVAVVRRAL